MIVHADDYATIRLAEIRDHSWLWNTHVFYSDITGHVRLLRCDVQYANLNGDVTITSEPRVGLHKLYHLFWWHDVP